MVALPDFIRQTTWKDVLKLIVPFGWGVTSFAAIFAYGFSGRIAPALFAFSSTAISFFLCYDIFKYHRTHSYTAIKAEYNNPQFVTLKLLIAIVFAVVTAFGVIVLAFFASKVQVFGWSDSIWLFFTCALAIIWGIDIWKYHYHKPDNAQPDSPPSASSSSRPTSETEEHELETA